MDHAASKIHINNKVDMIHNHIITKLKLFKEVTKMLITVHEMLAVNKKAKQLVNEYQLGVYNRILGEISSTKKHYILRCSPHLFVIRTSTKSKKSRASAKTLDVSLLDIKFDFGQLDFESIVDSVQQYAESKPVFNEDAYLSTLRMESINNKLEAIALSLREPVDVCATLNKKLYSKKADERLALLTQIPEKYTRALRYVINIEQTTQIDYEMCDKCEIKMQFYHDLSEFRCPQCGIIEPYMGGITYDIANTEKTKTTNNSHRHFLYWITHIQGCENMQISTEELDLIKSKLPQTRKVTYKTMRACLKDVKLTKYNANIPSLMYKITKIEPVRLTSAELQDIEYKFDVITKIYDADIRCKDQKNRPFNPYIIYKICEHKFANNAAKKRILQYIHIQSAETVMRHDKIFKKICEKLPPELGIKYKPTNYAR